MIESSEWPPDRANVTLNVGGDLLGIPFLTKPMLDLWVHALHGPNPFLIVGRVDVPEPDDFPAMGHITRDYLQSHLDCLNDIDLARVGDRQVVEAVEQVRSWLVECRRDDMDLVCFYH